MEQLDNVAQIAEVFGADKKVVQNIRKATETLKESLIDAIKELHPEHVFQFPKKKQSLCSLLKFISCGRRTNLYNQL